MKKSKPEISVSFTFFASAAFFLSGELCVNYINAVLFSFLHEIGHIIPMFVFGVKPDCISLDISGIKISKREMCLSFPEECVVAICGPLVNLVFMFIFVSDKDSLCFTINAGLFFINVLPVKSLDGGRFVFYLVSQFKNETAAMKVIFLLEFITIIFVIALLIMLFAANSVNSSVVLFSVILVVMIISEHLTNKG